MHDYVRRRRRCDNLQCDARFTTIEIVASEGRGFVNARLVQQRDLERVKAIVDRALGTTPDEPTNEEDP